MQWDTNVNHVYIIIYHYKSWIITYYIILPWHIMTIAPECTTGLLASATGVCSPRKSWQNVSQKCMKPRGYRGVVPFDTFENPTKINKDI